MSTANEDPISKAVTESDHPRRPTFAESELRHAFDVLDKVFQDEELPAGEFRFLQSELVELLRERGITRSLALALIEDLIERGVFTAEKYHVRLKTFVRFDGQQTDEGQRDRHLSTTQERWFSYVAVKKAHSERDLLPLKLVSSSFPDSQPIPHQESALMHRLHKTAVECVNVVLLLHYLRYYADGDQKGLAALSQLRDIVAALPPLPLAEDPFCREEVVEVVGVIATSAHAAALTLAQKTWQAVQLTSLGAVTDSREGVGEGRRYTRTTCEVVRQSPTEGSWSLDTWRQVCNSLDDCVAPDSDWFQAALAVEWNLASRRLKHSHFKMEGTSKTNFVHNAESDTVVQPPRRNTFRKNGDFWDLTFADKSIRCRDRVGFKHIAHLLQNKGRDVHAAMVMAIVSGNQMLKPVAGTEIIDEQAKAEYAKRYDDLHFQLQEATDNNDSARQEQIQREIDVLTQQITSAFGLGGRTRKMGDDSEKARKSVSNAIERAITAIGKTHDALASHLERCIHKGHYLRYSPEADVDWDL